MKSRKKLKRSKWIWVERDLFQIVVKDLKDQFGVTWSHWSRVIGCSSKAFSQLYNYGHDTLTKQQKEQLLEIHDQFMKMKIERINQIERGQDKMATAKTGNTGNFDELTDVKQFGGRDYHNLPFEFRLKIHQEVEKDVLRAYQLGRADDSTINMIQGLWDEFFQEQNPTDEQRMKQLADNRERDRIENIQRQLTWARTQLQKLDDIVKLDGQVPFGQREKLRAEIAGLEKELRTARKVNPADGRKNAEIIANDKEWFDSLL